MEITPLVILSTHRLTLRQFTLDDGYFIIKLLNSPGWLEFIGDHDVKTEEQAREYLLSRPLKSYQEKNVGLYLVELKHNKTPIGMCGLLKREYLEHHDIGFALLPEYSKMGYAYEIVQATMDYVRDVLKIDCVMAITLPTNKSSIRLLEKIGFQPLKKMMSPTTNEELIVFSSVGEAS